MNDAGRRRLLTKENVKDIYVLSPMQEGILFHSLLEQGSAFYHQQVSYRLRGRLDVAFVERALDEVVTRHDSLRAVFKYKNVERPVQIILKEWRADFAYEDLRDMPEAGRQDAHLRRCMEEDRSQVFDLSKDALMRVRLFQLADDEFELIWNHHHIIMDGWCVGILTAEFLEIYNGYLEGRPYDLPPAKSYHTYIQWLAGQDTEAARRYWRTYLQGYNELARFPTQRPAATQEQRHRTERFRLTLDEEKTGRLRRLAAGRQVTLYQLLQPLWGILLTRYAGTTDVVFGSVVSGRSPDIEGVESIIGLFINTLPVRFRLDAEAAFTDILKEVKAASPRSDDHAYFPLNEIQALSEMKSNLFDHILVFQNLPAWEQPGAADRDEAIKILSGTFFERTNYNLWLDILVGEQLVFKFSYNALVYDRAFVERAAGVLDTLIDQVLARPSIPLKRLQLCTQADRALLDSFNETHVEFPQERPAFQVFEQAASLHADSTALLYRGKRISYGELNARANRLARYMPDQSPLKADERVVVLLERSDLMAESILAIWKAGAAYVPVDVNYPAERILTVVADSGAAMVLTDGGAVEASLMSRLAEITKVIPLDAVAGEVAKYAPDNLPTRVGPDDLAYVIYTSGSTGKPKGAMIEHRGMLNHLYAKIIDLQLSSESVVAQNASHCFDISVWQFFAPLLVGGRTVIYDNEQVLDPQNFLERIAEDGVTILELVPSYLSMVMGLAEDEALRRAFRGLRYLLTTGEVLKPSLLKRWFELLPLVPVVNAYGPTEASDDITHFIMTEPPPQETVPVGRPLQNLKIYIADEYMNLCPVGVKGEILVSGVGVGRGYLNDPLRTAEVFLKDPFATRADVRLYRTGDTGRYTEDGLVEFFGRKDNQIKVRGFRLELEEVENTITTHPSVREAAVVNRRNADGETHLSACLVVADGFNPDALRTFLSKKLPDHMIPSYYTVVEQLPLTPNGKLDRKALAELPAVAEAESRDGEYTAPRNELEERLARLWREVLQVESVGVRDNFFDLGGDSFKAIRVVSKFGKGFLVPDLYRNPTVEALAAFINTNEWGGVSFLSPLTAEGGAKKTAFVCVPNSAGDPLIYRMMTESLTELTDEYTVYGVNLPRLEPGPGETMFSILQALVNDIVDEMRKRIKVPVILYGQCNGAALALQLARRMEDEGLPLKALCISAQLPRRRVRPETDKRKEKEITELLERLGATYPSALEDQLIFVRNFRYDGLLARASYNSCLRSIKAKTFRKIDAPLYNIIGDKDPLTRHYKRRYRDWLKYAATAQLVEVRDVGHFIWRDKPAELARILYNIGEERLEGNDSAKPAGLFSRVSALFAGQ
jgi:amino acid adenylation domain-containing protein